MEKLETLYIASGNGTAVLAKVRKVKQSYHMTQLFHYFLAKRNKNVVVVKSLSHVWLGSPVAYSMPGSSVLQYLPEFAQVHVHWVGDAI